MSDGEEEVAPDAMLEKRRARHSLSEKANRGKAPVLVSPPIHTCPKCHGPTFIEGRCIRCGARAA